MTAYEQLRQVTPHAAVVLAANPGPMTLDGTNTWLLRPAGASDAIVQYERGDRPMFPPTIATLRAIDGLPAVADVLDAAAARSIEAVRPLLGVDGEGAYVELPDGSTVRLPR